MNAEFVAIIQRLVAEQGREVLFTTQKCKAFLADYTHGEYKKENRLLLQAVEAGVTKELVKAEDLAVCKQKLVRDLRDDFFIAEDAAADVVNLLAFVLRGDTAKLTALKATAKNYQSAQNKQSKNRKPVPAHLVLEVDGVNRLRERWTCGRCNTSNDFTLDFCRKCGKEFNPPIVNSQYGNEIKIQSGLWEKKSSVFRK